MNDKPQYDEAGTLRRGLARGDDMSPKDNSAAAKASIEGGFWIAIVALVFSVLALTLVWRINETSTEIIRELTANAATSAEQALQAKSDAKIAVLYAQQIYTEFNRLGYPLKSPVEFDHELHPEQDPAFQE